MIHEPTQSSSNDHSLFYSLVNVTKVFQNIYTHKHTRLIRLKVTQNNSNRIRDA